MAGTTLLRKSAVQGRWVHQLWGSSFGPVWAQRGPKRGPYMGPIWAHRGPKVDQESNQNGPNVEQVWVRWWAQHGAYI
jgi:hypothetical protein